MNGERTSGIAKVFVVSSTVLMQNDIISCVRRASSNIDQ